MCVCVRVRACMRVGVFHDIKLLRCSFGCALMCEAEQKL